MKVIICDVSPRDGLQNESRTLSPGIRADLVRRLAAAGVPRIEAVSFVNPARVPQMSGAEEVLKLVERRPAVVYAGLVLNERGFDRAVSAQVDEVHYAFPLTDRFARENQNTTVAQAIDLSRRLAARARERQIPFTVTLSAAFGCPFEGRVPAAKVLRVAEQLQTEPPAELVLADTIGVGVPSQVRELVTGLAGLGVAQIGCHFHNTRNTAVANAVTALECGATVLDASVGGTGGCPFAPRAGGNVATEDLLYTLHGMGIATGIDLDAMIALGHWLGEQLGRELPSQVGRAGTFAPVAG
ncbi:MAG: hydroxymethylglutaryl-CoA lyase [Candidatus Dormibacter sp.]|uniref:hydroxymethylglutaryl-CoA lyase n=1 Tax=Candidatus Dormibacter sp. TaxID=2973982 RepID=UPI000DB1875B|nr:MAG: hydroxymethylglutaryl-CoA lyase [Candidatus Dormibacteraeota bacterium]